MYAVYDRKNLIAVHDDKHVAEKYIKSVYSCHGIELELRKIKRSSLSEEKRDSLYLTRYADTYVQSGYLRYVDYSYSQFLEDDLKCRDILIRIMEYASITSKEAKKLKKAIKVVDNILADDREYVPTYEELQNLKLHYDPYLYNAGLL